LFAWKDKFKMLKDLIRENFFKLLFKPSDKEKLYSNMNDYIVIEKKKDGKTIDGKISE
jgi:N-acetylglutamate synthase-like GNAT family acetyltransferase